MPTIRENESFEAFNRRVKEATQAQLTSLNEAGRLSHNNPILSRAEVDPDVKKMYQ